MKLFNKTSFGFITGFVLIVTISVVVILFSSFYDAEVNSAPPIVNNEDLPQNE